MRDMARVLDAQRRLGLAPTGRFDEQLFLALRRYQAEQGMIVTGELDDVTHSSLRETRILGPRVGQEEAPA